MIGGREEHVRKSLLGFAVTAGIWVALIALDLLIELVRGNQPWNMLQGHPGGRYLLIVIGFVLALGTAIGYASDRIRHKG